MMIVPTGKNPVGKKKKRRDLTKMDMSLKDYLTGEENRQLDALLAKAEARMKEKGEESYNEQFLLMTCQCCKCKQLLDKEEEKKKFEDEVRKIFASICIFCKGHDMCPEYCQEELPFP